MGAQSWKPDRHRSIRRQWWRHTWTVGLVAFMIDVVCLFGSVSFGFLLPKALQHYFVCVCVLSNIDCSILQAFSLSNNHTICTLTPHSHTHTHTHTWECQLSFPHGWSESLLMICHVRFFLFSSSILYGQLFKRLCLVAANTNTHWNDETPIFIEQTHEFNVH